MDSTAQAHHIEAQIDQLMARQIGYARHCRTRAAAVRESAEQITFPELRATMLTIALSYERIARSVEQCIRRLRCNSGNNVSRFLADGGRGLYQSLRFISDNNDEYETYTFDWVDDELGKSALQTGCQNSEVERRLRPPPRPYNSGEPARASCRGANAGRARA